MSTTSPDNLTIVVGAGVSGLFAARELAAAGRPVLVLDKGRSVGGRLATRRIGTAVLDHGAQFFTARDQWFAADVARWVADGAAHEWCRGFATVDGSANLDGHPRFVGTRGMNSLAKHLAGDVSGHDDAEIRCNSMVFEVAPGDGGWNVRLDDGTSIECTNVVITSPLPQTTSLLMSCRDDLPEQLRRTDYDRTIGLLVTFDGDSGVVLPAPGGLQNPDDVFSFIGDNHLKGVSQSPALTFHANPRWSLAHFDDDPNATTEALLVAARPYLDGCAVGAVQLKKWRFATPVSTWPDKCWVHPRGTLVLAGDAFDGPRVEGAALSGVAAARHLISSR